MPRYTEEVLLPFGLDEAHEAFQATLRNLKWTVEGDETNWAKDSLGGPKQGKYYRLRFNGDDAVTKYEVRLVRDPRDEEQPQNGTDVTIWGDFWSAGYFDSRGLLPRGAKILKNELATHLPEDSPFLNKHSNFVEVPVSSKGHPESSGQELSPIVRPAPELSRNFIIKTVSDPSTKLIAGQTILTSEFLVLHQQDNASLKSAVYVEPTADLWVYGDTVQIYGPIKTKGRRITIHCLRLEARPDGEGRAAALIVDGESGAQGGPGDNGSSGNPAGTIRVACEHFSPHKETTLLLSARGGDGGPAGPPDARRRQGKGGSPGRGGFVRFYTSSGEHAQPQFQVRGARFGKPFNGAWLSPSGSIKVTHNDTSYYKELGSHADINHLQMLFRRARLNCLAAGIDPTKADEKTIKKIKDSLLRLHKILEEIPPGAKEKEKRLDALYSSVTGLLLNLRAHQNVFGEKPSFVPHGSLPIYKNDLEETARILKDLELVHKGYFKALRAKEDTTRSLGLARKQRLGLNARLKSRREDVLTRFGTIGTSIEIADKAIRPKRKQLESKIDRFKAAIQRQCGLELRDFLDCLETMSFTSSEGPQAAAMGISQTGKLIDKGVNYLTDAAGDSVKKQYVIHQLDLLGRDVTDLTEAWKIGRDMQIQLDDPNAYKLLMEKQDFDRLCDRFLNLEGFDYAAQSNDPDVKVAKEAKDAMDGYVAAIQHRNEEVMAYNGAIAALADVEGQIEGIELQEKQIQAAINANTDPELPIMTTYVDILYEQAKELCLRELYCANRALTFWSLQDFDVFGHLLGESDPGQITHEMIEAGQLEITKRLEAAFESLARPMQKFPTENKRRGLKILLNDKTAPDVIADLKDRNVAEFSLEPGKPPAHAVFAGLANIRITRVRPWVKGMKSNNKIHHIIITHMGKESIVRPDGHIMEFSHTPVPTTFLYNAKKGLGKWKSIEEDGTIVETEGDKTFAQIGPFTRWRIGIYPNHNNNLDLSGLEEIILEFHGGNHTIDP